MLRKYGFLILMFLGSLFFSCSVADNWYFKEGGSLLWVNRQLEDSVIKKAVQNNIENSSIIIAQIAWSPGDSSFFENTAWYFSLAKNHGKSFMIAVDWQNTERSGVLGNWSFADKDVQELFKKDMLRLLLTYNPDYLNLGVEVNYYALTSPDGFRAFASLFRELKKELKSSKSGLKVGLSYQLELLYGHHLGWNQSNTFATLDNLLGDIDYLGISTYPNMVSNDYQVDILFSSKYIDSISNKYSIPLGISETGISSNFYSDEQRLKYVKTIFQKANDLNLKFVIWASMIDSVEDSVWSDKIGLLTKDGYPKAEFDLWKKGNSNIYN